MRTERFGAALVDRGPAGMPAIEDAANDGPARSPPAGMPGLEFSDPLLQVFAVQRGFRAALRSGALFAAGVDPDRGLERRRAVHRQKTSVPPTASLKSRPRVERGLRSGGTQSPAMATNGLSLANGPPILASLVGKARATGSHHWIRIGEELVYCSRKGCIWLHPFRQPAWPTMLAHHRAARTSGRRREIDLGNPGRGPAKPALRRPPSLPPRGAGCRPASALRKRITQFPVTRSGLALSSVLGLEHGPRRGRTASASIKSMLLENSAVLLLGDAPPEDEDAEMTYRLMDRVDDGLPVGPDSRRRSHRDRESSRAACLGAAVMLSALRAEHHDGRAGYCEGRPRVPVPTS